MDYRRRTKSLKSIVKPRAAAEAATPAAAAFIAGKTIQFELLGRKT